MDDPMAEPILEPFLNFGNDGIYNPLSGSRLTPGHEDFSRLTQLRHCPTQLNSLSQETRSRLTEEGWLVADHGLELSRRFRLRIASLEATTHCNQSCYFCPVSISPRDNASMPLELYEEIASQLADFSGSLEAVFMMLYNEPTVDPLFMERVKLLKQYNLPVAVNSNGSGLTPRVVDALLDEGSIAYLSINLSTLDRDRYRRERGRDQVVQVMKNLDYAGERPVATLMDIAVIGTSPDVTRTDWEAIQARYGKTRFTVREFPATSRAGQLTVGLRPTRKIERLRGCTSLGSRPIEHVHINAAGECLLCCEDYHERYRLGNLREATLIEILRGDEASRIRRWVYGLEEAPGDFLCRDCVFACSSDALP